MFKSSAPPSGPTGPSGPTPSGPSGAHARPRLTLFKALFPFLMASACLWLILHKVETLDLAALWAALASISPVAWALAGLATVASFWAVGRYDTILHRHFDTGVPTRQTVQSGAAAIALSQTLGFGLLTGSLVRWRLVPALGLPRALSITLLCAASFGAALAALTALSTLLTQGFAAPIWAAPLLLALLALPALSLLMPRLGLPSLPAMAAITLLALMDTLFAALAFLLLLPETAGAELFSLYPVFLIALAAGLFSGVPAGAGPFELTVLTLLPAVPEAELVAGLIGFRLIYFALPALLAALFLLKKPPATARTDAAPTPALLSPTAPAIPRRLLAHAPRAELGVARQNGAVLLAHGDAALCAVPTPQTLTALFDPAKGDLAALLPTLIARARLRNRIPTVYK